MLANYKTDTFESNVVHIDFEERVMIVMTQFFPSITVKCCSCHLGQAWWRKIQKVDLSSEYKEEVRNRKMDEMTFWYSIPEHR